MAATTKTRSRARMEPKARDGASEAKPDVSPPVEDRNPEHQEHIEYVPLEDVLTWPENPKDHDLGALHTSVGRFGFVAPLVRDERRGALVAGHGRLQALQQMRDGGQAPPARVVVDAAGRWLVPVVAGVRFNSDAEAAAYAVADNRLTEVGGWREPALAEVLASLRAEDESLLTVTGFDADDLDALLRRLNPLNDLLGGGAFDGPPAAFEVSVVVHTTAARDTLVALLTANGYHPAVAVSRLARDRADGAAAAAADDD